MKKLQIKTEIVELDGDYAGWKFTARVNPPMRVVRDISSGDIERIMPALASVITEWNFIDENGVPFECSEAGLNELAIDLMMKVATAYSDKVGNTEKN